MTAATGQPLPGRGQQTVLFRIVLGGVAVLLPLLLLWSWSLHTAARQGQDQLAALLAETEAGAGRWRWEQLEEDRPGIPADRNSWNVIERVATGPYLTRHLADQALPSDMVLVDSAAVNCLPGYPAEGNLAAPPDEQRAIALALSLKDYPRGRFPLQVAPDVVSTLLPHVEMARQVAGLLAIESDHQMAWNRPHRAAQAIHALLHLGALFRADPFLLCQQSRLALRTQAIRRVERLLGLTEPDPDTLAHLQKHLEAEAAEKPLLAGLRGERALGMLLFDNIHAGRVAVARVLNASPGASAPPSWNPLAGFVYCYHLDDDQALLLRCLNRAIEIAQEPAEQQFPAWRLFDRTMQEARRIARAERRYLLATSLAPPLLERLGALALRDQALLGCASAAVAVERFRRVHQRWPDTLAELVPGYLAAVPVDPFVGTALLYKSCPDGVAIYSVGRRDLGGASMAPPTPKVASADLGVRLYDPPQRRLPPRRRGAVGELRKAPPF